MGINIFNQLAHLLIMPIKSLIFDCKKELAALAACYNVVDIILNDLQKTNQAVFSRPVR